MERLAALSDGIFAVAMTLLVLDLRVPATEAVRSEHDLWHALAALSPQIVMYMMSFITLGIFWVGQQTQLNYLARSNRSLTWIHIGFLFAVTITPFSTRLLAVQGGNVGRRRREDCGYRGIPTRRTRSWKRGSERNGSSLRSAFRK